MSMRHSRRVWTGKVQLSKPRLAALELVHGKIMYLYVLLFLPLYLLLARIGRVPVHCPQVKIQYSFIAARMKAALPA